MLTASPEMAAARIQECVNRVLLIENSPWRDKRRRQAGDDEGWRETPPQCAGTLGTKRAID